MKEEPPAFYAGECQYVCEFHLEDGIDLHVFFLHSATATGWPSPRRSPIIPEE